MIDGAFFRGRQVRHDALLQPDQYLGALWMGAMARMHPELRSITMSPGNTAGTDVLRDQPAPVRIIASRIVLPYLLRALRIGHKLDVGAERFVKAVTDPSLQSGVFYASAAKRMTGPVVDEAECFPTSATRDQDDAYEAIRGRTEARRDLTLCAPTGCQVRSARRFEACARLRAPAE